MLIVVFAIKVRRIATTCSSDALLLGLYGLKSLGYPYWAIEPKLSPRIGKGKASCKHWLRLVWVLVFIQFGESVIIDACLHTCKLKRGLLTILEEWLEIKVQISQNSNSPIKMHP